MCSNIICWFYVHDIFYFIFKVDCIKVRSQTRGRRFRAVEERSRKNISPFDMDSILVNLSILDKSNNEISELSRKGALSAGAESKQSWSFDTKSISGEYTFSIEINANEDQIETYYFNNLGLKP